MTAATPDLSKLTQQELIKLVQKLQNEVRAKGERLRLSRTRRLPGGKP